MGGMGNMQKLLKEAQKAQANIARAQEEIALLEAEGSAGGGAVVAKVNGKHDLLTIKIDPAAVDPSDVETLEDLILAAVNQAHGEAAKRAEALMSKATGGLPGMF